MKKLFPIIALLALLFNLTLAQTQVNKELAALKYNLPEFHDLSVFKSRSSLTLFSPDGKYLAISGKSADVIIYDTVSGSIKSKIDGKGFNAFSFSPDSKFVVTRDSSDMEIRIFETESGNKIREIQGLGGISQFSKAFGTGMINSFAGILPAMALEMGRVPISPDWKTVLVNKNDKEFELIDFESGKFKFGLEHAKYSRSWEMTKIIFATLGAMGGSPISFMLLGSASNAQFSPDGKYLIIANGNKNPTLWEVESGKLINKFDSQQRIYFVQFSPNSKMLATSDFYGVTKISEIETGKEITSFGGKKDTTLIVGWNKESQKVYTIGIRKGDVRAFEAMTGKPLYSFEKSASDAVLPSNNGNFIVTVPRKNKKIYFQIWESETGKLLATVPRPNKKHGLTALKWSPDDQLLVTSSGYKDEVELWNLKGELLQELKNATFPMQFSADGKLLLTGGKLSETQKENDIGYLWELSN